MTIYLLKVVLCSALFLGCYFLIFQREKIYRFNRFYLLFSLFAPFFIPFIEIENGSTPINIPQVETVFIPTQEIQPLVSEKEIFVAPKQTSEINIPLLIYAFVSIALLFIFLKNIFVLITEIRNNEKVFFGKISIVLLDKKITPYSFMKYIFVNRENYERQGIEKEILLHEATHIQQAHSIDILIIELMKAFLWFNPLLVFYKKAIQLNHEFLADEAVINTYGNVTNYQYLLIEKASQPNCFLFTSSFNYSITKQRLKMMTKSTSQTKALLITLAFVPLFAVAVFTFSTKIYAQKSVSEIKEKEVASTTEGASDEMMKQYKDLIAYYNKMSNMKGIVTTENIDKNKRDKDLLVSIFLKMNKKQQESQTIGFMKRPNPLPRIVVSEKDFESYKNAKKYGLWINEKKAKNSELNNYKASDFSQVFISRLEGAAKYVNGVSRGYDFQLDMMTTDYYEKYRKESLEDKSYITYYKVTRKVSDR
jgi:bla regulator protein blaR1